MTDGSWYDADIDHVIITEEQIREKITELAKQVAVDYAAVQDGLLLVCVLKGAVMFMADFARALGRHGPPVELEFMAVSSYGQGTTSSGVVRILKDLDRDIAGRHVIVVEDIVDSGLTLSWLLKYLESRSAASVEVVALLRKPDAIKVEVPVKYVGFDIPNEFVVGLRAGLRRALPRDAVRRRAQARGLRPGVAGLDRRTADFQNPRIPCPVAPGLCALPPALRVYRRMTVTPPRRPDGKPRRSDRRSGGSGRLGARQQHGTYPFLPPAGGLDHPGDRRRDRAELVLHQRPELSQGRHLGRARASSTPANIEEGRLPGQGAELQLDLPNQAKFGDTETDKITAQFPAEVGRRDLDRGPRRQVRGPDRAATSTTEGHQGQRSAEPAGQPAADRGAGRSCCCCSCRRCRAAAPGCSTSASPRPR